MAAAFALRAMAGLRCAVAAPLARSLSSRAGSTAAPTAAAVDAARCAAAAAARMAAGPAAQPSIMRLVPLGSRLLMPVPTAAPSGPATLLHAAPDSAHCSSVLKKRRRKMNRHKHKKWLKKMKFKLARAKKNAA